MQVPLERPAAPGPPVVPDERLVAVRRYDIVGAPADGTFDQVARLAAQIFGTPIASVAIVDEDRVWLAATHGLDGVREVGADPGLCVSAVLSDEPYVVTDAALDPRTLHHPLVLGELGLRFYAAAPVTVASGHRLGTVNVIDREPRAQVPQEQLAMLTSLAAIVADHLDLRLAALTTVRDERDLRTRAERHTSVATREIADRLLSAPPGLDARPVSCQLGDREPCPRPAELKVADPWGDSAWGCLNHVEEVLLSASSVFVADESMSGLAAYLRRGRRADTCGRGPSPNTPAASA
jgi:hypothetical protein